MQPAYGTFGDLGRNSIYGPGYKNLDFSITKTTELNERIRIQLRAEFFNILNHPNFAQPAHTIVPGFTDIGSPGNPQIVPNPSPSGGELTQTPDVAQTNPGLGGGGPRVIQLALKVVF